MVKTGKYLLVILIRHLTRPRKAPRRSSPYAVAVSLRNAAAAGGLRCPGSHQKRRPGSPQTQNCTQKVKAAAKRKFDVYPPAYANAWLVRGHKSVAASIEARNPA